MTRVDRVTQVQSRKSPGAPVPLPAPSGAAVLPGRERNSVPPLPEEPATANAALPRRQAGDGAVTESLLYWNREALQRSQWGPRADRRRGRVSESRCWVS